MPGLMFCVVLFCQAQVHRYAHNFREVQQCTLLSIKTGGCSEDCSYCPQSSRYNTGLKAQRLMTKETVIEAAKRVCLFIFFKSFDLWYFGSQQS
jgi:biotin synthase-like enzyme